MHAWPCSPYDGQTLDRLAEAPWTELLRCSGCGALWETLDRGMRRATIARVREVFEVEVPVFSRPELGGGAPVRRVHLWLNEGALVRILVETTLGRWQVGERGRLLWMDWRDDMADREVALEEASRIAGEEWGAPAGAALELALETGFDPQQLGALDLAQGFDREDRERPWQPRTVELVDTMRDAGDDVGRRIAAALELGRRRGWLAEEDIRTAGFSDTN